METIKNYLEAMFAGLPNTPEVYKAKDELLQMMEDKYNQLISDGISENEAVGKVIAEFGNLDELADILGIKDIVNDKPVRSGLELSLNDAKTYIADHITSGIRIGIAVMLFIISPVCPMLGINDTFGISAMFIIIAIGVGVCVYNGMMMQKWDTVKPGNYYINPETARYIYDESRNNRGNFALFMTIGIILLILSFIPPVIFDKFPMMDSIGPAMFLLFVGLGVLMIISSNTKEGAYKKLLSLNDRSTIAGNYVPRSSKDVHYKDKTLAAVMSVYWPTVTCIYLIISFITFAWYITWIVWPIAAVISSMIENICGTTEE